MLVSLGLDESDAQRTQLDVYKEYFQIPFLDATRTYYKAESAAFVANNSVPDYMKRAEARLDEEKKRVSLYLNDSTDNEVSHVSPLRDSADTPAESAMRGGLDPGSCRGHDGRISTITGRRQNTR